MKGIILVSVQFGCLILLALVTNWMQLPLWAFLLFGLSGVLAAWAMIAMKLGNFNVVPTPVTEGIMVSHGPYKLIRHPMYTSIFIFAFSLLAAQFDYFKLAICMALLAGLVTKMVYEEGLLCSHYPGYKDYMKRTKRVIPFVW